MAYKKASIVLIVAVVSAAVAISVVTAGLLAQQSVPTGGIVDGNGDTPSGDNIVSSVNVGVYNDADATTLCSSIDWGTLIPGTVVSRTVYIKNTGDVAEALSMAATGWNPASADQVLTLGWNREGVVLTAGSVVPATFTLTVAPDTGTLTTFNFNIVVSGTA